MRSGTGGVRVTRTPEDPKVVIARRATEESVVWSGSRRSTFNLYHQAVLMTCGTRLHAIDYSDGINEKCPSSDGMNEPP